MGGNVDKLRNGCEEDGKVRSSCEVDKGMDCEDGESNIDW
jgi:hypothetical protein